MRFGAEHPNTLMSLHHLAELYRDRDRLDEAERLRDDALDGSRRVLGKEHPFTLALATSYAGLLQHRGRLSEAEAILVEGLTIVRAPGLEAIIPPPSPRSPRWGGIISCRRSTPRPSRCSARP